MNSLIGMQEPIEVMEPKIKIKFLIRYITILIYLGICRSLVIIFTTTIVCNIYIVVVGIIIKHSSCIS